MGELVAGVGLERRQFSEMHHNERAGLIWCIRHITGCVICVSVYLVIKVCCDQVCRCIVCCGVLCHHISMSLCTSNVTLK